MGLPLLRDHPARREPLAPQDQPGADPTQRHAQQDPFELDLPAGGVDDQEPEAGQRREAERHGRLPLGPTGRSRHDRVPVNRVTRTMDPSPISSATNPSMMGPAWPSPAPPRSWGRRRYRT